MPLLDLQPSGIALEGGKDVSKMPTIIGLTLNDSVIDQLVQSFLMKETVELSLGDDPKITFGQMTQRLTSSYDPFHTEIYRSSYTKSSSKNTDSSSNSDQMAAKRMGFMELLMKGTRPPIRTITIDKDGKETAVKTTQSKARKDPVTAGTDAALATLQASLATAVDEKKAKQTKVIKPQDAVNKKGSKGRLLNSHGSSFVSGGTTRSMPTSPSLAGVGSPRQAPTSAPSASEQAAEKTKAIRSPIIHILAIEPASESRLHRLKKEAWSEGEFLQAIDKVADKDGGMYVLRPKMYKELDVWNYKYSDQEDRQKAIDNAVKAYDKMRLESSAAEWERLLTKEERGTGKCLSKLQAKIATGTAKPPRINVQKPGDGTESGVDSAADDTLGTLQGEDMTRSGSQPPHAKHKKASEKELQAKRLLGKGGIVKSQPKTTKKAAPKAEEKFKSSAYIEDSDEDLEDTIVTSAVKPKPTSARKGVSPASKSTHKRISSTNSSSGSSDTPIAKKWMSERKSKQNLTSTSAAKHTSAASNGTSGKSPVPKNPVMHKRKTSDSNHETSPAPNKRPKTEDSTVSVKNAIASPNPSRHRISDASKTSSSSSSTGINATNASGRPRSSTQKSSPLGMSPPTNASSLDDAYHSSSSTDKSAASVAAHISSKTKSSANGAASRSNLNQHIEQPKNVIDTARKFKIYYKKYLKDYRELENVALEDRGEGYKKKVEELCEMHERLRDMKRVVVGGYVRS